MKKILLTGKDGQLGWELQRSLTGLGKVYAFDRQSLNLQDPSNIRQIIHEIKPQIIVNAAAYTAVDKAETDSDLAHQINGIAPGVMAEEAKKIDALLVHYSTDYIFNGFSSTPYLENTHPHPLNIYGQTKLSGENAILNVGGKHFIFRTTWVYSTRGKNFLLTILRLAKEKDSLKIVADQIGAPTWSRSLAETTSNLLNGLDNIDPSPLYGIYHMTAAGQTSWFDFSKAILKYYQELFPDFKIPTIHGITTQEYPLPAKRPSYSVLSNEKLEKAFDLKMPAWESALKECLQDLRS